ncbi:hypothetical protein PspLS_09352 [Pyricularia sp. CBS 133598]|nr:hypothetical protein PspLS_09352 [Pyricularia sp. CBS 133598]
MQLRGPLEKGVTAYSLSFSKRSSPSQRSGCRWSVRTLRNKAADKNNTVRGGESGTATGNRWVNSKRLVDNGVKICEVVRIGQINIFIPVKCRAYLFG